MKYKYDFINDDPDFANYKEYSKEFDRFFKDEMTKSDALPEGLQIGKIFTILVADNYAYYEVIKVFKTTVRLKWRKELSPDHYADHHFYHGGSFDRNEVEKHIEMRESMKRMFEDKKEFGCEANYK